MPRRSKEGDGRRRFRLGCDQEFSLPGIFEMSIVVSYIIRSQHLVAKWMVLARIKKQGVRGLRWGGRW